MAAPFERFGGAGRTRNVAAESERFVKVDKNGLYEFALESHDGLALFHR